MIKAHKNSLMACSDYFRDLFSISGKQELFPFPFNLLTEILQLHLVI